MGPEFLLGGPEAPGNAQIAAAAISGQDAVLVTPSGGDDSAALQAAIDTGLAVVLAPGDYSAANLTQSEDFQRFTTLGQVLIEKNANGPIITASGSFVEFSGIQFKGDGFTGDNVVATGQQPRFINCASTGAAGRALKATGNHVQIIGTCGTYTTADQTASGWDVEIGVSGTATLYHEIHGLYSATDKGGILLVDTGSHSILGGQFGKLKIQAGTSPSGVNGGKTIGARILGDVTVQLSSAVFSANQFGTQTILFDTGTSKCSLDGSNHFADATVTNNGNHNAIIVKSVGDGSPAGMRLQYGADAAPTVVNYVDGDLHLESGFFVLANNKGLRVLDSAGTPRNGVTISTNDDYTFGGDNGANYANFVAGSAGLYLGSSSDNQVKVTTAGLLANYDGSHTLGGAGNRWSVVYASTGSINTSDAREKQQIRPLNSREIEAAKKVRGLIRAFRFNDAVERKGDGARIHVGVIAQDVISVFESAGLDPFAYGVVCFDRWDAQAEVRNDDGVIISPAKAAGERLGVRYEELLAFVIAAL